MRTAHGRQSAGLAAFAAIMSVLAACGGSSSTSGPTTATPGSASTTAKVARTTIGTLPVITETTAPPAPTTVPGPSSTAPGNVAPAWFVAPSGNIGCRLDDNGVQCDIKQANRAVAKAADCSGTITTTRSRARSSTTMPAVTGLPSFEVSSTASKGEVSCQTTSVFGGERVRRYPARATAGSQTCEITDAGVECRNQAGHGFFLSKQEYRLF